MTKGNHERLQIRPPAEDERIVLSGTARSTSGFNVPSILRHCSPISSRLCVLRKAMLCHGSCGMLQPPLTHDSGRKRGSQMKPALEALLGPDQDVRGRPCASKRLIGKLAPFALVWRRIGDDDQQVEVAIWPVVAARLGTEEVDALRCERSRNPWPLAWLRRR